MEAFLEEPAIGPAVRGVLHRPAQPTGDGIVLTHGAGSNREAPVLRAFASAFADAGWTVLRCDLPFRQTRAFGPPFPAGAAQDREGLGNALAALRKLATGRLFLGGHSYGGRQASMLAASDPEVAAGLLLLSYPLHPPKRPDQLRTGHFPSLRTRSLFAHGARDPFGTFAEMHAALATIPAATSLIEVPGAGHELIPRAPGAAADLAQRVVAAFLAFVQ